MLKHATLYNELHTRVGGWCVNEGEREGRKMATELKEKGAQISGSKKAHSFLRLELRLRRLEELQLLGQHHIPF